MFDLSNILSLPVLVFLPLIFGLIILLPFSPNNDIFVRRFAKSCIVIHLLYSALFWIFYDKGFVSLYSPEWIKTLGIKFGFVMDELALVVTMLTTIVFSLAAIASKLHIRQGQKYYYALLLFFETTILGIFNASDIFTFFLFWELELIPAYFLIGYWGEGANAKKSAMKFILYTFLGSLFMLIGLIMLHYFNFLATNSLNGQIAMYNLDKVGVGLQTLISILLLIGFGVKLPIVPIHTWLPDAHTDAPTPISMILAGILLKTGAYAIIRFNLQTLPQAFKIIAPVLAIFALINILYTALVAYAQTDIKRIVAYSSISNMGLILLGICSMNIIGLSGAVFHIVGHGIITAGLFAVCGIVFLRCRERDINKLGGIAAYMPRLFGFATIIILASIGLPSLAGFIGEVITIIGTLAAEFNDVMKFIALFALPVLILSSCYMLKFLHRGFFGNEGSCKPSADIANHEFVILMSIVVILFILGTFPSSILDLIQNINLTNGAVIW